MIRICDESFDERFSKVAGLSWLPWVGVDYARTGFLVVAESHYVRAENNKDYILLEKGVLQNGNFTRQVMSEYPIELENAGWRDARGSFRNPTFDALLEMLAGRKVFGFNDKCIRERIVDSIAFFNKVQRPMSAIKGLPIERPSKADFNKGWIVAMSVLNILRPKVCLILGSSSARAFEEKVLNGVAMKRHAKIGRYIPRSFADKLSGVNYIMTRHPGKFFATTRWCGFVESCAKGSVSDLRAVCKISAS